MARGREESVACENSVAAQDSPKSTHTGWEKYKNHSSKNSDNKVKINRSYGRPEYNKYDQHFDLSGRLDGKHSFDFTVTAWLLAVLPWCWCQSADHHNRGNTQFRTTRHNLINQNVSSIHSRFKNMTDRWSNIWNFAQLGCGAFGPSLESQRPTAASVPIRHE